jgi:hypothetical protein
VKTYGKVILRACKENIYKYTSYLLRTPEVNIKVNFRIFISFHLSTGNTNDRHCLNYAAQLSCAELQM